MKVKILEQIRKETEVDIELPLYRVHRLDNSTIYMKVESLSKQVNIHVYHDEEKVEIEIEKPSFCGECDYVLGKGIHSLSEDIFNHAVNEAKEIFTKI